MVNGDLLEMDALRRAFAGVRILSSHAVTTEEFTQALVTLNVAREAGVERVACFSVIHADRLVNVPHFAVKSGANACSRRWALAPHSAARLFHRQ